MTGPRSCYLPPCGGANAGFHPPPSQTPKRGLGYARSVREEGKPQRPNSRPPPSPTLPHKGGGSRRKRAVAIREGAPGSLRTSRRSAVRQHLLHRGVGEPFAVDRHGVALFCHVTALGEKFHGVVAGIDRE